MLVSRFYHAVIFSEMNWARDHCVDPFFLIFQQDENEFGYFASKRAWHKFFEGLGSMFETNYLKIHDNKSCLMLYIHRNMSVCYF